MNQIINIVKFDTSEFEIKGQKYIVTDEIQKFAKRVFRFYTILIVFMCLIGDYIAVMLGVNNLFQELLVIIFLLVIYNLVMDYIIKKILIKKAQ